MDLNTLLPVVNTTPHQLLMIGLGAAPYILLGMLVVAVLVYVRQAVLLLSRGTPDSPDKPPLNRRWLGWVFYLLTHTSVWFICVVGIVIALHGFPLGPETKKLLARAFAILGIVQMGLLLTAIIHESSAYYLQRAKADGSRILLVNTLITAAILLVWALMGLMALDKLGINVTAMLAGLGLGGVALAFATKNIFENMFAAFSILLNPPFVIGDFISSGEVLGTVEQISLKNVVLRALSGEQYIVPNSDMLGGRIRNFTRMKHRRVEFRFGIGYAAARPETAAKVPALIKDAITAQGGKVRFDRAHMVALADNMLMFEGVYWVLSADYNTYMDIQQDVLMRIYGGLEDLGIRTALGWRMGAPGDFLMLTEKWDSITHPGQAVVPPPVEVKA